MCIRDSSIIDALGIVDDEQAQDLRIIRGCEPQERRDIFVSTPGQGLGRGCLSADLVAGDIGFVPGTFFYDLFKEILHGLGGFLGNDVLFGRVGQGSDRFPVGIDVYKRQGYYLPVFSDHGRYPHTPGR